MQTCAPSGTAIQSNIDAMPFWNDIFESAMVAFVKQSAEPKELKDSKIKIRDANSWGEVQICLQTAQDAYIQATGVRGWIRKSRRVVADNSQLAVQGWKWVPNVEVTSPVVNVVQSLLEAIRNAANVRKEILVGFDGLEETFTEIDFVFSMFPKDTNVRDAGIGLVATMLDTVEKVIGFYKKGIVRKMSSALFQGDEYQEKILQGLQNIKIMSEKLSHQGKNSHMFRSRQDDARVDKVGKVLLEETRTTYTSVSNIENMVVQVKESQESGVVMLNNIFHLLDEADKARKENTELRRRQELLEQKVQRAVTPVLVSTMGVSHSFTPPISPEILWKLMDVSEIETVDIETVELKRESISSVDHGRFEQVVNMNRFKRWIVNPHSDTLLLQDSCRAVGGVTASSAFCSTVFQALRQRQSLCPLVFFCGLHDDEDTNYGGTVLLRSFIAQLLCRQPFNTNSVQRHVHLESVQQGDIAALLRLFSWLMHQIAEDVTVVCIIDNIGYYERDATVEDTVEVVASISRLINETALRAATKLLATSNTPVRETRPFFRDDSVINLSAVTDFEGSSKFRMQRQLHNELDEDSV
ncbi:uncharacterized protein EKO05_0009880 [Ascochyta rabiei]|uniref:uncharacterized protein n=1 Tax=Didymella rabiei TaxID=5454 RepID=UPI0022059522|nr:uncharacterized protein EKO05_0009880 [Ascochyta rabiei]UPX19622.1 hypothetical protein EKO05_0009880 [Ascochyta rabiei]